MTRTGSLAALPALVAATAFAGAPPTPSVTGTAGEPALAEVMRKAGEYVVEYGRAFALVVAEEEYVQRLRVQEAGPIHQTRVLRSDVVFVRSPGTAFPWWLLRDVYKSDGVAVRDRQQRLEALLVSGSADSVRRARAIADEGARFNLGVGSRNYNVPTLVLTFLHPEVQPRFAFERRGTVTVGGRPFAEIAYRERSTPTLIHPEQGPADIPASGLVLIDPHDGTVARTTLSLDLKGDGVATRSSLETTYRAMPSLGLWVPVEMKERWETRLEGSRGRSGPVEMVDGIATYSGFRRAEVDTQQEIRTPEP